MKKVIKRVLGEKNSELLYVWVIGLLSFFHYFFSITERRCANRLKRKRKILYLMTPSHTNIGDSAIALGTYEIFKKTYPNVEVIEFSELECLKKLKFIKKIVSKNDLIFLHGGGNLGDWYITWELIREKTIKSLKNNSIIVLPQTISFANKKNTNWILTRAKKVYSLESIKMFFARGSKSYYFAKNVFDVRTLKLSPDTALCIPRMEKEETVAKKIGICFRNDIEKMTNEELTDETIRAVLSIGYNYVFTDTMNDKPIDSSSRSAVVYNKIMEFSKYDLVVTDRYHGVIFSYLAHVPCLALPSKDKKVSDAIPFFKDLDYIKYCDNSKDIYSSILSLINKDTSKSIDFYSLFFKEALNEFKI